MLNALVLLMCASNESTTYVLGVVDPIAMSRDKSPERVWTGLDGEKIFVTIGTDDSVVDFGNGLAMHYRPSAWTFIDKKDKKKLTIESKNTELYSIVSDYASACFPLWPHLFGPSTSFHEFSFVYETLGKPSQSSYIPGKSFYLKKFDGSELEEIGRVAFVTYEHPFLKRFGKATVLVRYLDSWRYHNMLWALFQGESNKTMWFVGSMDPKTKVSSMPWVAYKPETGVLTSYDKSKYQALTFEGTATFDSVQKHPFMSRFLLFGRSDRVKRESAP